MSLYDLKNEISLATETRYKKRYQGDYIVAKFYKNGTYINLFYKNYSKGLLRQHINRNYEKKYVSIDFWDPSFCTREHLLKEEQDDIKKRLHIDEDSDAKTICGYVIAMINLHKIILKSYIERKIDTESILMEYGKNVLMLLFLEFDMVISFNNVLINFIFNIFDGDKMLDFMLTPSGKFRFLLQDMRYFLIGTKRAHHISTVICQTHTDVHEILVLHLELLKFCDNIYTPSIITSFRAENILLNLLKLDIDLDKHEKLLFSIIDKYLDKEGELDITFDFKRNDYENFIPTLDAIKEYHLSSNSGSF